MARVQVGYDPRAEALQTTAAPNIQAVRAQYDPRSSTAFQLAEALGKQGPLLEKFNEDMKADKRRQEILDNMKIPAFIERAQQEVGTGVVDGVQAGRVAPGASEVVNARTNDGLGADWGRKNVQGLIDAVNADATLIQDPVKRAQFIAQKRRELIATLPKDNDFFVSGALGAMDKEINSFENKWQAQSTAYAVEVQTKDFTGKVVEAFGSNNPDAALLQLDQNWKVSSALNNNTRNQLVVDTATKLAYGERNPAILDKIPERFLNAETKAKITQVRAQIQELKLSDYRAVRTLQNDQREDAIRTGKTTILSRLTKGEMVDPAEFQGQPELYKYVIDMKDAPRLPTAVSTANLQKIRTAILNQATVEGLDQNQLIDQIQGNTTMNPADKEKLITEVPRLIEGNIAMNDDMVKSSLNLRLEARLKALEASPNALVQKMVTGTNLRSQVLRSFDVNIRNSFQSFYEDNGKWPTGRAKQDIVDRETERAENLLEKLTDPKNIGKPEGSVPASTPRAAAPTAPATPAQAPVRIKDAAQYNALPSGTVYITPEGVTKRKP